MGKPVPMHRVYPNGPLRYGPRDLRYPRVRHVPRRPWAMEYNAVGVNTGNSWMLDKLSDVISLMLASRMELFVDLFELAVFDLRVDLRCLNIGMTQHLLDQSQVGSACQ